MKLHDLHVLMTVVQAGSMSKAAALLNTTQPAISRSIAELERTVGVRLLDRNAQGVEPTEYGRALLDGGVAVFDDLRQAVKNIEFLADPTDRGSADRMHPLSGRELCFGRGRSALPALSAHRVSSRDRICGDAAPRTERA